MKKGFTLIELLAVIVILAIIALIATPTIITVVETSNKSANEESTKQVVQSAKYYFAKELLAGTLGENNNIDLSDEDNTIEYDGKQADGGTLILSDNEIKITEKIQFEDYYCGYESLSSKDIKCSKDETAVYTYEPYLHEVVNVGDWVNYDAGNWTTTAPLTNIASLASGTAAERFAAEFTFSGYTSGQSRNNPVNCNTYGDNEYKGWRVLTVNRSTGVVKLIHAGTPECFFFWGQSDTTVGANAAMVLSGRTNGTLYPSYPSTPHDWSYYVNSTYATSANSITQDDVIEWVGQDLNLDYWYSIGGDPIAIAPFYWVANEGNSSANQEQISAFIFFNRSNYTVQAQMGAEELLGVRPVVVLKPNLKIDGKQLEVVGIDGVSTAAVWQLKENQD